MKHWNLIFPFYSLDILDHDNCDSGDDFPLIKKRRKLKSSTLHCRHCGEVFTSKVSFKLHQQRHTEEARQEGALYGEDSEINRNELSLWHFLNQGTRKVNADWPQKKDFI